MVSRIVEKFDPAKVILFGSYAGDTVNPDSDVDLLVVMDAAESTRAVAAQIDLALADRRVPLDLIVVTQEQFDRDKDRIGTIVRPAVQTGRVLYERAA